MARQRIDYLTDQQERIIAFIRHRIEERGEAPTLTEIGAAFGLRSRASVHWHLERIEQQGAIIREPGRPRGIRLT